MKIIRMLKTSAGPKGVFPKGQVRTVDDLTAAILIDSDAAELVATIAEPPPPRTGEGPRGHPRGSGLGAGAGSGCFGGAAQKGEKVK